jgi:putative peptidoglycan lipid II flippase
MSSSLKQRVGIAALIMMASVFLSRVAGLLREMVIAHAAGAGAHVDAYQVAFVIPEILNHILASGFLSVTFIPIFARYISEKRQDEGWQVFSTILTVFGSFLILLILAGMILAPSLVALVAPGIRDPQTFTEAVKMTRIIMPAQFFFFSGGLFMAVQFAREKFFLPALAPLVYNVGIILGGLLLGPYLGVQGFAWGVLGGAFVGNFAVQYLGAKHIGMNFRISFDFHHPDLKRYILLTLPLMLGLTMTFSTEFFMKFFGSYLPAGSISALNYGLRIMFLLVGILGQAVGVASFPFMARLAVENKIEEMNRLLNRALRFLAIVIPFALLIMVVRKEVVVILFQRGAFDAHATRLTTDVLIYLLLGTAAFATQTVVVRGFYAMQNTLFPAIFGSLAVLCSIPFYMAGMRMLGVGGVALAISLSATIQVALLYALWNKKSANKGARLVYRLYLKTIILCVPMGGILVYFRQLLLFWIHGDTFFGGLAICFATGALFLPLLAVGGWLLRIHEILEIIGRMREKLFLKKEMT